MDETEYAVPLFLKNFIHLEGKRIALYGTGKSTQAILGAFPFLSGSVVVDDAKAGWEFFGKKVFSIGEACGSGIDAVVIVARESNLPFIYNRIAKTCNRYGVSVFDLAGRELGKPPPDIHLPEELYKNCRTRSDFLLIDEILKKTGYEKAQNRFIVKTAREFGYCFIAPILLRFFSFLVCEAKKQKLGEILLASRDGYILYKLYELLKDRTELPRMRYFYTSRSVAVLASLKNGEDIEYAARLPFSGRWEDMLRYRFRVSAAEDKGVKNCIPAYRDEVLKSAQKVRSGYLEYIDGLNIKKGGRIGFFDFVSSGTAQKAIEKITGLDVVGLYFARTLREANYKPDTKIVTLYGETNGYESGNYISGDYARMENILTSPEPYLTGFSAGMPEFAEEVRTKGRLDTIQEVHAGILEFAAAHDLVGFADISKEIVDLICHFSNAGYTHTMFRSPFEFEYIDEFSRPLDGKPRNIT